MRALSDQFLPRVHLQRAERPPRPARTAAVYALVALASLGAGFAASAPWPEVTIAPVSLFLVGLIQTVMAWDQLVQRRRSADQWLRFKPRLVGSLDTWRVEELTSARERRSLARSVRDIVSEIQPRWLGGAAPLNRVALRTYADELTALADRLADLERPVSGSGILLVRELLSHGGSPLYIGGEATELRVALDRVRAELEVG